MIIKLKLINFTKFHYYLDELKNTRCYFKSFSNTVHDSLKNIITFIFKATKNRT